MNKSTVLDNSRQFVGYIRWTENFTEKYPDKITGLLTSICRGTVSHNVYLTENSLKLKTVCTMLYLCDVPFILE